MTDKPNNLVTIERALLCEAGRRFFCDGPPQWREGPAGKPPKSAAEARRDRALLAKALRRDRSAEARALAEELEACRTARPCLSGACPSCGRALQRLFVHATRYLVDEREEHMLVVSVVCRRAGLEPKELADCDDVFELTRVRLHRALADVGVPAFGGLDISLNDHEEGRFAPYWSPHAQIFAPAAWMRRGEARFDEWFLSDDSTPRPLVIKEFDGRSRGRAYAVKPDFVRRTSLKPRMKEGGHRSTFSTRKKPIWGEQRVELALALDRAGLDAHLFLHGYELVLADGIVEIVRVESSLRSSKPRDDSQRDHLALARL
jgi:hypothetical protein